MVCSLKIELSRLSVFKILLAGTCEAFWSGWRRLGGVFRRPFGMLLATLTGVRARQIQFLLSPCACFGSLLSQSDVSGVFGGFLSVLSAAVDPLRLQIMPCDCLFRRRTKAYAL